MNRPALAHTLAALTDGHVARYTDVESVQSLGPITRPGHSVWPWAVDMAAEAVEVLATRDLWPWPVGEASSPRWWAVETPAEAVEVLATRDLWPWPVGEASSPRWWCEECRGCGAVGGGWAGTEPQDADMCPSCGVYDDDLRGYVDGPGNAADPPSLAALVAVAALGCDTLRSAEGLALQLVGRAPRIVWRVMSSKEFRAWVNRPAGTGTVSGIALGLSCGMPARDLVPLGVDPRPFDDLHELGLHIIGLDGDRVTLAVEAI